MVNTARDRHSDLRARARALGLLLGLLAATDVLGALFLHAHAALTAGVDLSSFEAVARQPVEARSLLVVAGCLLVSAGILTRSPLGDRATNLTLALAVAAWVGVSARSALSLAFGPSTGPLDLDTSLGPLAVRDGRLGHRLMPGRTAPYRTNADGFRGPLLPPRQSAAEWRVVAVGDSITFGWLQFGDAATYPWALERELRQREPGRTIHVLNAGVPSYTSLQAARLVEDRLSAWRPDLLIVCIGWNDLSFGYEPGWSPLISVDPSFRPARRLFRRPPGEEARLSLDPRAAGELRRNLTTLVSTARSHAVDVLLLNLPTVMSRAHTEGERRLAGRVADVDLRAFEAQIDAMCGSGVPCFLDAFPFEETGKERYFIDHCHLTAAGGRELARRLAEVLMMRSARGD